MPAMPVPSASHATFKFPDSPCEAAVMMGATCAHVVRNGTVLVLKTTFWTAKLIGICLKDICRLGWYLATAKNDAKAASLEGREFKELRVATVSIDSNLCGFRVYRDLSASRGSTHLIYDLFSRNVDRPDQPELVEIPHSELYDSELTQALGSRRCADLFVPGNED